MGGLYPGAGFLGAYSFGSIIEGLGEEVTIPDIVRTVAMPALSRTVTLSDVIRTVRIPPRGSV